MKVKVLIVDDNDDIRFTIKTTLKVIDQEYSFKEARNGEDALKILEKYHPDIIIMDLMMPGMDGIETTVNIKENEKTKDIPVLFLSAKTEKLSLQKAQQLGEEFMEKPFEPKELDRKIKEMIQK